MTSSGMSSGIRWTPRARRLGRLATASGLVLVLAVGWAICNHGAVPPRSSSSHAPSPTGGPPGTTADSMPRAIVVWTTGGLPAGFGDHLAQLSDVDHVVTVAGGTAWLTRSKNAAGAVVDQPTPPNGIPLEVFGASPGGYAPFVPASLKKPFTAALRGGKGVIGQTSSALRKTGPGGTLEFGEVKIKVALVVPDAVVGASGLFVSTQTAGKLQITEGRYALLDLAKPRTDEALSTTLQPFLATGQVLRVFAPGEKASPYERVGGTTVPPVFMMQRFGEFSGRPDPARPGWIAMDPAWVSAHIKSKTVPILGRVTCNEALFTQLIGALNEIRAKGLADQIHSTAGCYAPRMVTSNPTSGISQHAWGAAIDINAPENPFGVTPTQDRHVVRIFEKWGFLWGGDFAIPDGMHFEYLKPPPSG
jgi:hypothetical protein